jgi:hypothetical protein
MDLGYRLRSNSALLAARDEFEFGCIQLHRRVSRVDVIPCSLLQGEFIDVVLGYRYFENSAVPMFLPNAPQNTFRFFGTSLCSESQLCQRDTKEADFIDIIEPNGDFAILILFYYKIIATEIVAFLLHDSVQVGPRVSKAVFGAIK